MSSVLTPRSWSTAYSLVAEVVADRPDHADVGEEARRQREVHGRAAEHALALAERRLDGVERDRSDDGEAHGGATIAWRRLVRAVQIKEFGGPEVLEVVEDAPVPEPGEDEVLIKVSRAGMNFADTHARENSYLAKYELPLMPGGEVAGTRRRTANRRGGAGRHRRLRRVRRGAAGARRSRSRTGWTTARRSRCCIQGLTAWHLYRTSAKLAAGRVVVVHAAAGGVGSLAVQLGKPFGRRPRDRHGELRGEARAGARAGGRRGGGRRRRGPDGAR